MKTTFFNKKYSFGVTSALIGISLVASLLAQANTTTVSGSTATTVVPLTTAASEATSYRAITLVAAITKVTILEKAVTTEVKENRTLPETIAEASKTPLGLIIISVGVLVLALFLNSRRAK